MSVLLPNSINYSEPLSSLPPDTVNIQTVCNPTNGTIFPAGSQIIIKLGSRGFLDPASLRFNFRSTSTSAGPVLMVGTPAYTPFQSLVTEINSTSTETIPNYNVICNMLTNLRLSHSDKLGQQYSLGYVDYGTGAATIDNEETDGRLVANNEVGSYSAPLYNCLSFAEKMIPLFIYNDIRLIFNIDSLTNMCSTKAAENPFLTFNISDFEVVYNMVDFGSDVANEIYAMDKIRIKSQSFTSSSNNLASGAIGNINSVFTHSFASVKNCYLNCGGGNALVSANKNMDAYDITSGNGSYQLQVNGTQYPAKALSTIYSKAGILQELRKSMNSIFDKNNSMSINSYEYSVQSLQGAVTTNIAPAKFWVPFSLQKLTVQQKAYFTGVNTNGSGLTLTVNIGTATTQSFNLMLILNYDLILEADPKTKQVALIK